MRRESQQHTITGIIIPRGFSTTLYSRAGLLDFAPILNAEVLASALKAVQYPRREAARPYSPLNDNFRSVYWSAHTFRKRFGSTSLIFMGLMGH